jgi:uncharacterized protein (DUF305 family)
MEDKNKHNKHEAQGHSMHYKKLLIMTILSFISMYILMYAMVDRFDNVVPNINQFYMAGLMASPMVIIELSLMGAMYMNKKLNSILIAISGIAMVIFYMSIRQQSTVSDKQFLKSMIPHHAGAILMSEKANINDPEIRELQRNIISSQESEIKLMKATLKELEK